MRADRSAWVRAGLTLLRGHGEGSLTIERVCAGLGLSKGSFYHHFQNIEAYRQALLDDWSEAQTDSPIFQAAQVTDAAGQLRQLGQIVAGLDHALDVAFRVWSLHSSEVRDRVGEIDRRRQQALEGLYRALGQPDAPVLARQTYTALVGAQMLGQVGVWAADQQAVWEEWAAAYSPEPTPHAPSDRPAEPLDAELC